MTVFFAIVTLIAVAVLGWVLHPLVRRGAKKAVTRDAANLSIYRDQLRELEADLQAGTIASDHYERAKLEIERRLLDDVGDAHEQERRSRVPVPAAVAIGAVLAFCALGLYWIVGTPEAMHPQIAGTAGANPHELSNERLAALTDQLAARMKENPEKAEGWAMLARSYAALGRFDESTKAYAEATQRITDDAQLWADYADVAAMMNGRRLQGAPEQLISRALAADPQNIKALALAGSVEFEKKNFTKAAALWEKLIAIAPVDSPFAASVRDSIAEARQLAGGPAASAAPATAQAKAVPDAGPQAKSATVAASGSARISGVASLAPSLSAKVKPEDIVFIFARAAEGPRMPLAVLRKQAKDLPIQFTLDDSMAMAPGMNLSAFPRVVISARVSKSANPAGQPGDFQGESPPVAVGGAQRVNVVIDTEMR